MVDGMRLRGIIDRLDIAPDGSLIVVDYKTGRAPSERYERGSLGGVQTYALLCESVLGRAPAEVRLLHLREPVAITAVATPSRPSAANGGGPSPCGRPSSGPATPRTSGPRSGPLCNYCHFKASCPAFAAA